MRLSELFAAAVHMVALIRSQISPSNEPSPSSTPSPPSPTYESQPPSLSPPSPWSVRMANSIMIQSPDLVLYNGASKVKFKYDFAMLGIAICKLDDGSKSSKYYQYAKDFIDELVMSDGTMVAYDMDKYNLDYVQPAKLLILLYQDTGEPQYLSAIETIVEQLEDQPRTESGGLFHKLRYPYQMWLDGIYMSPPFMAQYAQAFGEEKWYDEAVFQITHIYDNTRDVDTGLLYHAWQETREEEWSDPTTGRSPSFWGRAVGWFLMGVVDTLDFLPEDHEGRDELIVILQDTTQALMKVRDLEQHLWYQVLDKGDREGNYLEASASAMFTYVFAKASKRRYIGTEYFDYAMESFDAMLDHFLVVEDMGDGGDDDELITLKNVASGIGLGFGGGMYRDGSFEYYTGVEIVDNDAKGVGPFILAAIELGR
mmetsp:Transcript_23006/g.66394  ORF Transcript_23006/g.66394 Transcript_23006/m.66394 type:complete len:426 (+) Transcript_23006:332-1609(+)